jgi:hypothetical protein
LATARIARKYLAMFQTKNVFNSLRSLGHGPHRSPKSFAPRKQREVSKEPQCFGMKTALNLARKYLARFRTKNVLNSLRSLGHGTGHKEQ